MKEISALDLRKKFGEVLDAVRYTKEAYVIKKNGRQVVVMMDIEAFRHSQEKIQDELFIENYSDARIRSFLETDRLTPSAASKIKRAS